MRPVLENLAIHNKPVSLDSNVQRIIINNARNFSSVFFTNTINQSVLIPESINGSGVKAYLNVVKDEKAKSLIVGDISRQIIYSLQRVVSEVVVNHIMADDIIATIHFMNEGRRINVESEIYEVINILLEVDGHPAAPDSLLCSYIDDLIIKGVASMQPLTSEQTFLAAENGVGAEFSIKPQKAMKHIKKMKHFEKLMLISRDTIHKIVNE
jgi:hypothetical protein